MIWHCSGSRERSASSDSIAPVGPQGSLRVASRTRRSTCMDEDTGVRWQGTGVSAKCWPLYDTLCRLAWSCYSIALTAVFLCARGSVRHPVARAVCLLLLCAPQKGFLLVKRVRPHKCNFAEGAAATRHSHSVAATFWFLGCMIA